MNYLSGHYPIIKNRLLYLLILILLSFKYSNAQDIVVRDIPSLDKLPVNAIHRIFQDSDGYMWYGTFNGLCRNDGYNIRVFRSDLYHPGLLSDNYITYIAEDHEKKIWFGTTKGGYILDKATCQITPVDLEEFPDKNVFTINVTNDGTIWISVSGALLRFKPDGTLIRKYAIKYHNSPEYVYIVYEDKEGDLLISITKGGMYKLNRETDSFEAYFHHKDYMDIERIIWDNQRGYYWLGTWGKGIVRFDPKAEREDKQYVPQPLPVDIMGETTGAIYHMVRDDVFNYIWVTSWKDLFAFRVTDNDMLEQVNTSPFLTPGNKILYEIFKDKDGKLWVSSFDMKSFIIDIREYIVKEYPLLRLREHLKANPAVAALCRDEDGVFWLSQERYGLCIYNPDTEALKYYTECKGMEHFPFGSVSLLIKSLARNRIWAVPPGTKIFGLTQENMSIRPEVEIDIRDVVKTPGNITSIFEDNRRNLWIGTTTGLFIYNIQTNTLDTIPGVVGNVAGIIQTADNRIWVVLKNKGIICVDPNKQAKLYSFDKNFVCIATTSDGKLWTGTSEGEVLLFSPDQEDTLIDYSFACGMKGDIINNITIDVYNHVWITTNQMIKEFNPRNGAYRSYTTHDQRFLLDRIFSKAIHYDKNGPIYFGGISGIVSIPPTQQLESIPEQVTTHITDIKIMGKSLWENGASDTPPIGAPIKISPKNQNLEIEFSSLDFHNLNQIRYAYKLAGVDNDWVYLSEGKNTAFYNKLDKGKYLFQVKATDKNGLWSDKITEVIILRLPAYYETWWAYIFYVALAGAILWTIISLYLQRVKQENNKMFVEKITQTKLRYFTNISHELLTPLTILSCLADEIDSTKTENEQRKNLMQSNIRRLKRLLQQVLDFRKIESRSMKLFVSYGDILSFVRSICEDSFALLMRNKNIKFLFSTEVDTIEGYFDHDKLDKILFNLLSNAFKYTPTGKAVTVKIRTYTENQHEYLEVRVKDEGVGIAPKELEKIFTRFYNNKFNDAGLSNGIGLSLTKELAELHHGNIEVQSQVGEGTEFTIRIPIDRESYNPDEFKDTSLDNLQNISLLQALGENRDKEPKGEKVSCTLLLVEDNEELLLLMENIFAKTYSVLTAKNGLEALQHIKSNDIDVVISDIMMPGMNGFELCKHIKSDISTSHIIVILLTAKTSLETQIDSYEVGADEYIAKPFETKLLKVRLESLLKRRQTIQTEFKNNPQTRLISSIGFTSLDEQLIEKALSVVESNLSDTNLDVSTLAEKLNMSRSTLSRKIKAITGQTPLDFIKDIKMKHACRMLENQTTTVSEVIVALGYNDHKHFTNSFKEAFGVTPSEYQKKNKA